MGKSRIDPNEKIMQKSIGFPFRQHLFFNDFVNEFKPDPFCRDAIEKQIIIECEQKGVDPSRYLKDGN